MEKVSPTKVGERIKAIRGDKTQTEFAKELGVRKQNYISRYERGRIPAPDLLVKIADMGRVSTDWLLTGKKVRGGSIEVRESSSPYRKSTHSGEVEGVLSRLNDRDRKTLLKMIRTFAKGKTSGRKKR
jgi:transcriptional regulator with XRE-family HTH domain